MFEIASRNRTVENCERAQAITDGGFALGSARYLSGRNHMRYAIVAMIFALSITDANAVVYCAAGAYHAGCVRRPPAAAVVAPRGAVVVAPHCRIIDGRRVCR